MSEKPILREARAAVFAAVCMLVAVIGHDAFSPGGLPLSLLAGCTGVLYLAARPLTARERGLPSILGAMGAVQLGLHEVFAAAQHYAASVPVAAARPLPAIGEWWCGDKAPHGLAALLTGYPASALSAAGIPIEPGMGAMNMTPHATGHPMGPMGFGMLAAHVLAALVAVWWLRRGEAAVWGLGRTLATRVLPLLGLLVAWTKPTTAPSAVQSAFFTPNRVGPGRLIRFTVARRGPPAGVVAFC